MISFQNDVSGFCHRTVTVSLIGMLTACQPVPAAELSAQEMYRTLLEAPIAPDTLPMQSILSKPGRYDIVPRLQDVEVHGLSDANGETARGYYSGADGRTQSICVTEDKLKAGASGILQSLAAPDCANDVHSPGNRKGRSGSFCERRSGKVFSVAEATSDANRGRLRTIMTAPGGGYIVIDWSLTVSYRGPCNADAERGAAN